jgi:tyrosyl-tRNA synthetase
MPEYYRLATALSGSEVDLLLGQIKSGSLHPRDAKMRLARAIVALYHGEAAALAAEEGFKKVFQKGEMPAEMASFNFTAPISLVDLMLKAELAGSKSEARRLIEQNGVRINSETVSDIACQINQAGQYVVQVGKRKFARIDIA